MTLHTDSPSRCSLLHPNPTYSSRTTAGLKAIYLSGWQVAGDANTALQTYPDQSLYPADSVPKVVERINNAFIRADQIQHSQGKSDVHWFAPIVVSCRAVCCG